MNRYPLWKYAVMLVEQREAEQPVESRRERERVGRHQMRRIPEAADTACVVGR